jgi:regulator of replication initiation timing
MIEIKDVKKILETAKGQVFSLYYNGNRVTRWPLRKGWTDHERQTAIDNICDYLSSPHKAAGLYELRIKTSITDSHFDTMIVKKVTGLETGNPNLTSIEKTSTVEVSNPQQLMQLVQEMAILKVELKYLQLDNDRLKQENENLTAELDEMETEMLADQNSKDQPKTVTIWENPALAPVFTAAGTMLAEMASSFIAAQNAKRDQAARQAQQPTQQPQNKPRPAQPRTMVHKDYAAND